MLPLDSPQWRELRHAYGQADDLPALLRQLYECPFDHPAMHQVWLDLWGRLCHQGDIYSASIAAVHHLVAAGVQAGKPGLHHDIALLPMAIEESRIARPHQVADTLVDDEYNAALITALQLLDKLHRQPGDGLAPLIRSARKMLENTRRGKFLPPQQPIGGLFDK